MLTYQEGPNYHKVTPVWGDFMFSVRFRRRVRRRLRRLQDFCFSRQNRLS